MERFFTRPLMLFLMAVLATVVVASGFYLRVFAQSTPGVNVQIVTPVPVFSMVAVGSDGVDISWNWDFIAPSHVPSQITQMDVEIALDGGVFGNLQNHAPGDFLASYTGLTPGEYTARVTVIDGNNFQYNLGPVSLAELGGGRRRLLEEFAAEEVLEAPLYGAAGLSDVTLAGLAYPGQLSSVQFTYEDYLQIIIVPDDGGFFTHQTDQIPTGLGNFSFVGVDPEGRISIVVSDVYDVPADSPFQVDDIYLPPTIVLEELSDDLLMVTGYGYSEGEVKVSLVGPNPDVLSAEAGQDGLWFVEIDLSELAEGSYSVTATAISSDENIVSPVSEELTFLVGIGPVCGDGVREDSEECDDRNTDNGDGCSASCLIEGELPETVVEPLIEEVFSTPDVQLDYAVLSEPNGPVEFVEVYLSRDGGPFELYEATFSDGVIELVDLLDGDYELYSLGTDAIGFVELVPGEADISFTVDVLEDFTLLVSVQAQEATERELQIHAVLSLFVPGEATARYSYDVQVRKGGVARVDIPRNIEPGVYDAVLKADGYLSRKLEGVSFASLDGLVVDFTRGGTVFLLAGDVALPFDDVVNALDIVRAFRDLFRANVLSDLNQDDMVNAFDMSFLMANFYQFGEGGTL